MKSLSSKKSLVLQWMSVALMLFISVNVYAQPVANFSCSSVSGCAPILVSFTDQSAGNPTEWKWDLGNGTVSYLQNPSVTYFNPGSYTVKLVVKSGSKSDSVVKVNHITIYAAPVVEFSVSKTTACNQLNTNFTDLSTAGGSSIAEWEWDFGDGVLSNIAKPSHTYDQTGEFNVTLKVKNSNGCSAALLKKGIIKVNGLKAAFTKSVRYQCNPQRVYFYNKSIGNGTILNKWYFDNKDSSKLTDPVCNYVSPGIHTIKLITINNYGCIDSAVQTITLDTAVSAAFSVDKQIGCSAPFAAHFSGQELNGNSFVWKINDSITVKGANPVYTFRDTGFFNIKLIVTNSIRGCVDSVTKLKYIKVLAPSLQILNLPDSGCLPFTKKIITDQYSANSVNGLQWNFGDGSFSNAASPIHTYTSAGYFDVTLFADKTDGCIDTISIKNAIHVTRAPLADFKTDVTNACAYTKIHFTNLSSADATKWGWEFNEGTTSEEREPVYTFKDSGYVSVTLVAFNGGCSDTVTKSRLIYLKPSVAKLKYTSDCSNPGLIKFSNQSIVADTWKWTFGDGTTSTEWSPLHQYTTPGEYSAWLETNNNATKCYYLQTVPVKILSHKVSFYASDTIGCKNQQLKFSVVGDTINFNRFTWDMGDGNILNSRQASIVYEYAKPGNYTVRLMAISSSNCVDSVVKENYIRVNGPSAKFGMLVTGGCVKTAIPLSDSSISDKVNRITNWQWNYGDGTIENKVAPPFSHSYSIKGDYKISLQVTDAAGCIDSFQLKQLVSIRKVAATLVAYDTLVCAGNSSRFIAAYAEQGVTYFWNFGDGTSGIERSPDHVYLNQGLYSVKLNVTDHYGCSDSVVKKDIVRVEDPIASFIMSDSFKSCPPLLINFTNNSLNASDEHWDFGDGSATNVHSPSHFYSYPGEYIATLTVKSGSGCVRQMQRKIVVKGPKATLNYDPLSMCAQKLVNFKVNSIDAVSYTWDFNDGATLTSTDTTVTHTYTNAGTYVPKIILMDEKGCRVPVTGKDTVYFATVTGKFIIPEKQVCDTGIVHFKDSSITNDIITAYQWNFGDGATLNNLGNTDHVYKNAGVYYPSFTVKTLHGCSASYASPVPVMVLQAPKVSTSFSGNGCAPLTANFDATLNSVNEPGLKWRWDFGNGTTYTQQHPPQQLYNAGGNYIATVSITGSNGCTAIAAQTVQAFAEPALITTPDTAICIGSTIKLNAAGAATYLWSGAAASACKDCAAITISPTIDATYTVKGFSVAGCSTTKTILVKVKSPFKLTINNQAKVCAGKNIVINAAGADKYQWSPSEGLSNPSVASPSAGPTATTVYKVTGTDEAGCFKDTGYVNVLVVDLPTVDAGLDKTINAGSPVDLIPAVSADVIQVNWSPTSGIFRNDQSAITVKPAVSTEYTVEVKNRQGCTASDKVKVLVNENTSGQLFLPNTFSPNGDGANEIFYPRSGGSIKIRSLVIINRNGEIVFEKYNFFSNDVNAGWNGLYKGAKLQPDVFIYTIGLEKNGDFQWLKGDVALIR